MKSVNKLGKRQVDENTEKMPAGKRIRRSPRLFDREVKRCHVSILHSDDCQGTLEDVDIMEARLEQWPNLLEYRQDDKKETPLISAVINQHEHCVHFLLSQGADVHATMERKSVTMTSVTTGTMNALVLATSLRLEKNEEKIKRRIIKLLLKFGSDPKSVINIDGDILPLFANLIENNCTDYIELFLQNGADPNDKIIAELISVGFSYITCAILKERHQIVEILLKYGARVDSCETNIFLIPINRGLTKCLKSLLIYNTIEEMKKHRLDCDQVHIPAPVFIINFSPSSLENNLKSLRMFHKFGGDLWESDNQLHEINDFDDSKMLYAEMERLRSNPMSLKELSRVALLKTMGRKFPQFSDSLELPATLHTFLKFPDVET